jgi:hypothetical protein
MRAFALAACGFVPAVFCLSACKSKSESKPVAPPVASASAPVRLPPPARRRWALPAGPALEVLAAQGVGPIRIGATVATIERHMQLPCEVSTPEVCRYITRGVEFLLENGVVKTVHVHRAGRPAGKDSAGKDAEYGFFKGAIRPDLQLGMIPSAIQEYLGPPKQVESREVLGEALNVQVHRYDGLRIEYDRLANGNLVMGGIIVVKEPLAADAGAPLKPRPRIR